MAGTQASPEPEMASVDLLRFFSPDLGAGRPRIRSCTLFSPSPSMAFLLFQPPRPLTPHATRSLWHHPSSPSPPPCIWSTAQYPRPTSHLPLTAHCHLVITFFIPIMGTAPPRDPYTDLLRSLWAVRCAAHHVGSVSVAAAPPERHADSGPPHPFPIPLSPSPIPPPPFKVMYRSFRATPFGAVDSLDERSYYCHAGPSNIDFESGGARGVKLAAVSGHFTSRPSAPP